MQEDARDLGGHDLEKSSTYISQYGGNLGKQSSAPPSQATQATVETQRVTGVAKSLALAGVMRHQR